MKTKNSTASIVILVLIVISFACKTNKPEADLILLSGKVASVDENFSIHEAVVIKANKFIYVGSDYY